MLFALPFIPFTDLRGQQLPADSLPSEYNGPCLRNTAIGLGAAMAGTFVLLDKAWYADYDRAPFHTFDDSGEWLQMDKGGHFFNVYQMDRFGHALFARCGASRKASIWAGGSLGLLFLTGVEVLDGTSSAWGFSWSDMAANTAGTAVFIGQELLWDEQRIQVKLSSHPTDYARLRPDLLGEGLAEEVLKDYNGHTFWLSANLKSFMPQSRLPDWLNVSVGYGAEGMISAFPLEPVDGVAQDHRYRQYYLAPDLDLTRIRTRSKVLRTALFILNGIKVPMPTLEFQSTGNVVGHWLYF